jgi:hypothetical protein
MRDGQVTLDGTFGDLTLDSNPFTCKTVERTIKMIDPGTYEVTLDVSPRLGYLCPHIKVPNRDEAAGGDAGIRIHKFNEPQQSEGCIAPVEEIDGDAGDDSKMAFDALVEILKTADNITLLIQ